MENKAENLVIEYTGENSKHLDLTNGKRYKVLTVDEHRWYRIVDDSGDDYIYPPEMFTIVE